MGGVKYTATARDAFLVKLGTTGAYIWSKKVGLAGNQAVTALAVNAAGEVMMGGNFDGTLICPFGCVLSQGGQDIFLFKYSGTGQQQLVKTFGAPTDQLLNGMVFDPSGNLVLVGQLQGPRRESPPLEAESEGDLARLLSDLNAEADALQNEIAELKVQLGELRRFSRDETAASEAADEQLRNLQVLAGTTPVTGNNGNNFGAADAGGGGGGGGAGRIVIRTLDTPTCSIVGETTANQIEPNATLFCP
jgi:hypothetical protein